MKRGRKPGFKMSEESLAKFREAHKKSKELRSKKDVLEEIKKELPTESDKEKPKEQAIKEAI